MWTYGAIDMYPQSKLFLKQGINTGFQEFKHPNSLSRWAWAGGSIDLLQQMVLVWDYPALRKLYPSLNQNGTTGTIGNLFVDLCTSLICSARLAAWVGGRAITRSYHSNAFIKSNYLSMIVFSKIHSAALWFESRLYFSLAKKKL